MRSNLALEYEIAFLNRYQHGTYTAEGQFADQLRMQGAIPVSLHSRQRQ